MSSEWSTNPRKEGRPTNVRSLCNLPTSVPTIEISAMRTIGKGFLAPADRFLSDRNDVLVSRLACRGGHVLQGKSSNADADADAILRVVALHNQLGPNSTHEMGIRMSVISS
jgi:hypothetical protein